MNGYNEIDDFVVANNIVRAKYGSNACLEEFQREYKKKKKVLTEKRYRFVNVLPIARYPSYGFKSVLSAMNALTAHETGLVSYHRYVKYKIMYPPKPDK